MWYIDKYRCAGSILSGLINSSGSDALNLKTFITDTKNKYNEEEKKNTNKVLSLVA